MHAHAAWITRNLDLLTREDGETSLVAGAKLAFLNETLTLSVSLGRSARAARQGNVLAVTIQHQADLERVLESWYRTEARRIFGESVAAVERSMGVRTTSLTVRGQRTRWGSCSTRGALSLNWRLLLAPREVMRYVVVHEVAHLREHNHSARFWAVVERECPDFRDHRRWLRNRGHQLRRFTVEMD
jgi:predicted metal-dependent hydrolase